MPVTFPLSPSGLPSVDNDWGGFNKGGTYILVGHASAGRLRHVLNTVRASFEAKDHCLLISARPQTDLIAAASEIGLDLQQASQLQKLRLLKAPLGKELAALGDEGLAKALTDLIQLARKHQAGRVVMDDFSSFVQFREFDAFADAFRLLVREAAIIETTLVLGLGEPANDASRNLLQFIEGEVAGTVHATVDGSNRLRFEALAGTAHALMPKSDTSSFSDKSMERSESEPALLQPIPKRAVETPPTDHSALPPFELSIPQPNNGGDGGRDSVDSYELTTPSTDPDLDAFSQPLQSSGDTAWARITRVSKDDAPFSPAELDQFLRRDVRLDSAGYFVDSADASNPLPPEPASAPDLARAASAVQQAAYPHLFAPVIPSETSTSFQQELSDAFARRASEPFLVMALRITPDDAYADLFPAVAEGVRIGIGQSGTMLSETDRLIALIPGAGADVARNIFAILKAHLRTIAPDRADSALQHVNAMAVPDGKPFTSAAEIFAHAFAD